MFLLNQIQSDDSPLELLYSFLPWTMDWSLVKEINFRPWYIDSNNTRSIYWAPALGHTHSVHDARMDDGFSVTLHAHPHTNTCTSRKPSQGGVRSTNPQMLLCVPAWTYTVWTATLKYPRVQETRFRTRPLLFVMRGWALWKLLAVYNYFC